MPCLLVPKAITRQPATWSYEDRSSIRKAEFRVRPLDMWPLPESECPSQKDTSEASDDVDISMPETPHLHSADFSCTVSACCLAEMQARCAALQQPLQFLKVIHVGASRKQFEQALEMYNFPLVRGACVREGMYVGFPVDRDFASMRICLSAINWQEIVEPAHSKKRPRNTESRLRYKYEPFLVAEPAWGRTEVKLVMWKDSKGQ